jgi:hypothetical protein
LTWLRASSDEVNVKDGDINGQTITVTGNGTLALARNANAANITVNSPCVTVALAQNF